MDLNDVLARLHVVPHFLSETEIATLLSIEEAAPYDDLEKANRSSYRSTLKGAVKSEVAEAIYSRLHGSMKRWYGETLVKKSARVSSTLIKYYGDEQFLPHIDGGSFRFDDGGHRVLYEKRSPHDFNSIIYLNEPLGGKLWFPLLNMEITPKPGTLVSWPSKDVFFLHGSTPLRSPVKIGLINFFEDDSAMFGETEEKLTADDYAVLRRVFAESAPA
jgi:hypothetical protein